MVEINGVEYRQVDQVNVVRDINQLTGTFSFRMTFNDPVDGVRERINPYILARVTIYMGGYQLIEGEIEKFSIVENGKITFFLITGRGIMNRLIDTGMPVDYPNITAVSDLFPDRVFEKGSNILNRFRDEIRVLLSDLESRSYRSQREISELVKADRERILRQFYEIFGDSTPVSLVDVNEEVYSVKKKHKGINFHLLVDPALSRKLELEETKEDYTAKPTEKFLTFYLKWFGRWGVHLFETHRGDLVAYSSTMSGFPNGYFERIERLKNRETYTVNPMRDDNVFRLTRANKISSATVSDASNLFQNYFFMSDSSVSSDNPDLKMVVRQLEGVKNGKTTIADAKTTTNSEEALNRQADMYINSLYKKSYQFQFKVQGEIVYPTMLIDASDIDKNITLMDDLLAVRCEYNVDAGVTTVSCARKQAYAALIKEGIGAPRDPSDFYPIDHDVYKVKISEDPYIRPILGY